MQPPLKLFLHPTPLPVIPVPGLPLLLTPMTGAGGGDTLLLFALRLLYPAAL